MEPVEMFRRTFYVHIYRFESLCGADILRPDFRPHKWTFFWMTVNASFSLCSVYTLFAYEVVVKWKCLSCIGITIQGLVKYAVVLYNATKIRTKVEFLHSIYKANGDSRTNNYRSLKKYGHMSLIVVMVGAAMVCSSCAVFLPFTKLENYVTNKHEPLLQGYLPLVDANTDVGYFVLYVYHLMLLFLAGTGTTAVDVLLTLLVLHLWPMADIIQNMSDVLNERVLERRSCESAEMERFFRNFILVHKEFCKYDYLYIMQMYLKFHRNKCFSKLPERNSADLLEYNILRDIHVRCVAMPFDILHSHCKFQNYIFD